ncbi:MAG: Rne/Rng family ribonuclease, partial [Calditrichia bacterium]|nr:Rne/Rng family ribonuclease [Calditrichia bacterium]
MKKEILINSTNEDTRIAILEDKRLVEVFVERPDNERMVGDIYKGRVKKIITGMQAAFVDIGNEQDAFLHFSDFGANQTEAFADADDEDDNGRKKPSIKKSTSDEDIAKILKNNKEIMVQIVKEPIANKGPRVTNEVSLPGRFVVLVPNENRIGISRKISDRGERRRLKKISKSILPENYGLIIRTVASGKSEKIIKDDLIKLIRQWKIIEKKKETGPSPLLLFKDMSMASSIIRDFFTNDVEHVVVDSRKLHKDVLSYLKDVAPNLINKLEHYKLKEPLFDAFKVEDEIHKSLSRKVWLKNGGYLFIEQTEALVSVDVNSGKYFGKKDHEDHSLKINMEAAREVARQIRLRDLGGLIVIDFIDMSEEASK